MFFGYKLYYRYNRKSAIRSLLSRVLQKIILTDLRVRKYINFYRVYKPFCGAVVCISISIFRQNPNHFPRLNFHISTLLSYSLREAGNIEKRMANISTLRQISSSTNKAENNSGTFCWIRIFLIKFKLCETFHLFPHFSVGFDTLSFWL